MGRGNVRDDTDALGESGVRGFNKKRAYWLTNHIKGW